MIIKKKCFQILLSIFMLFLAGCSSNSVSSEKTTKEVHADFLEGKAYSDDFSGKLTEFSLGDFTMLVPAAWQDNNSYLYPVIGSEDNMAMLYISTTDEGGMSDQWLASTADAFLEGVTGSIDNAVIQIKEQRTINKIEMMYSVIEGSVSGRKGLTLLYWFVNPSDGAVNMIIFFQGAGTELNYLHDLEKIINSVKLNPNVPSAETGKEAAAEKPAEEPKQETAEKQPDVPDEYTAALKKAESYNKSLHMSKAGLFDQLTSEYGEHFSEEAAQYAVDHVEADWYENALKSAESYNKSLHMSKKELYEQLVSEYGAKFEPEEAQYAIDNVKADWYENALKSAESYNKSLHMSKKELYEQLVSEYGSQFEPEEAQYAIDHIEADWKENALESAKSYRDYMDMSADEIYDQLISPYGNQFEPEEAQYAVDHLND